MRTRTVGLGVASVQLLEAQVHEERAVDEHAVGVALDLEVGEQHVGAEEREDLVHDVGLVLGRGGAGPRARVLMGRMAQPQASCAFSSLSSE